MKHGNSYKSFKTHNVVKGRIKLTSSQEKKVIMMTRIISYFFKGKTQVNNVFRGFLLVGPPGSGKTEIAEIVCKYVRSQIGEEVKDEFVDSARIAAPHWGEAESNLKKIFNPEERKKKIILLDDIECLFLKRGFSAAKEWHYSINSLLLHKLDKLDPSKIIVIATTNRPDLIDAALRSRLYEVEIPIPPRDELITIAENLIENSEMSDSNKKLILSNILKEMEKIKNPSIRDIQHLIVKFCIELGVWM